MKKLMRLVVLSSVLAWGAWGGNVFAQDAEEAAPAAAVAPGTLQSADGGKAEEANKGSGGFLAVVKGSGPLGIILWLALFGAAGAAVYFAVDCAITVRVKRIMPQALVDSVTQAMGEGDVVKALKNCENEPGPLSNVLTAGFSHVEEGFDVIQESITTAADLETERIMQKLTWISVLGNISPMLGLLGTVQGMIAAFANLAGGAPDINILALSIAQALYTTAAGLSVAIPCVALYYIFRNAANKIILKMEALTMELIKDLRNVEVVEE